MTSLKIGKLAKLCDISVETIRYYESRGLLDTPVRTEAGYRQYSQEAVDRLGFIRRAKLLGFSLEEVRELLELQLTPDADSGEVKSVVDAKIELIDGKISELCRLKHALEELSSRCDGKGSVERCPILGFLKVGDE